MGSLLKENPWRINSKSQRAAFAAPLYSKLIAKRGSSSLDKNRPTKPVVPDLAGVVPEICVSVAYQILSGLLKCCVYKWMGDVREEKIHKAARIKSRNHIMSLYVVGPICLNGFDANTSITNFT